MTEKARTGDESDGADRVLGEIVRFVGEVYRKGSAGDALGADTRLLGGSVLDSIGLLELTVHLEEVYGVAIPADDVTAENFATLGRLARYLQRKGAAA
jgi:acyl carrier protein